MAFGRLPQRSRLFRGHTIMLSGWERGARIRSPHEMTTHLRRILRLVADRGYKEASDMSMGASADVKSK